VYKNYDPRAKIIKKLADEVFDIVGRDPLVEVRASQFHAIYRCSEI
jgi:citrate synthase